MSGSGPENRCADCGVPARRTMLSRVGSQWLCMIDRRTRERLGKSPAPQSAVDAAQEARG